MRFLASLRYALRGVGDLYLHEVNFRLDLAFLEALLAALWLLGFPRTVTAFALLLATLVLAGEAMNGALERTLDALHRRSPEIRKAKDRAAGAVLLLAAGAVALAFFLGEGLWGRLLQDLLRRPGVLVAVLLAWGLTFGIASALRRPSGREGGRS